MGGNSSLAHQAWTVALAVAVLAACRSQSPEPPGRSRLAVDTSRQIGWVDSSCLAIANDTLAPGTPVTIVALNDNASSIVEARVVRPTDSTEICSPLLDDRRPVNAAKGASFYEIALPPGQPLELGIGIAGAVTRAGSGLDVNGGGMADRFTQCTTSEGVSFAVWSGTPYQGMPLWSGYYYLAYDTESTCPA